MKWEVFANARARRARAGAGPGDEASTGRVPSRHRGWTGLVFDVLSVFAVTALGAWMCWQLVTAPYPKQSPWLSAALGLLSLTIAWLFADLLSGVVHRVADCWGDPRWLVIGPLLIQPFREHHEHPEAILNHGFLERNGANALAASLPLAASAPFLRLDGWIGVSIASLLLWMAAWTVATNQIHAWAHCPHCPSWVVRLQQAGIILSPDLHRRHHREGHDSHYCITSGFWDRLKMRLSLQRTARS